MKSNLSIVIPTHNSEKTISKVITTLLRQKYNGKYEIIAIDNDSRDKTSEILKQFKNIRFIRNPKNIGFSKSILRGMKTAKYDNVLILHDDCIPESRKFLQHMTDALGSNKDVIGIVPSVYIPKYLFNSYSIWAKIFSLSAFEEGMKYTEIKKTIEVKHLGGVKATLLQKNIIRKLNLFYSSEFKSAGEDFDASMKIKKTGYKILQIPSRVQHLHWVKTSGPIPILRKSIQVDQAWGVLTRKYGLKILGIYNPITKTLVYSSLLIPYIRFVGAVVILAEILYFMFKILKIDRTFSIIAVPPFRIIKDLLDIISFWFGYVFKKQWFE